MYIETSRLIIRPFKTEDITHAVQYLGDSEVMHFIEEPFDYEKTHRFIHQFGMCESPLIYAVVEKQTNHLIGHLIFHEYEGADNYELGWILCKRVWGLGYATEISQAVISYAFTTLNIKKIIGETTPENTSSIRIFKKLEMQYEGIIDGLVLYSLSR